MVKVSASILSADFAHIAEEVAEVEAAGVDSLHIDVMDGHYVPNITMGPAVVRGITSVATVPCEAHLMITDPGKYAPEFAKAGVSAISFHPEVVGNPAAMLSQIRGLGVAAGVAVNPDSDVASFEKLFAASDFVVVMTVFPGFSGQAFIESALENVRAVARVFDSEIAVDGGVSPQTAGRVAAAGGNVLVAASAIFGQADRAAAVRALRAAAESGEN